MNSIAFFITPHGFGHAARSCAIIEALKALVPDIKILIFTTVPKTFFQDSIAPSFYYYSVVTDIGFVQKSSLEVDIFWTLKALNEFYPIDVSKYEALIGILQKWKTKLIVSDISALGIVLGRVLQIKTVLIENFTWDWIYSFYSERFPELSQVIRLLKKTYESADYRIRTIPYCGPGAASIVVPPVSRKIRGKSEDIRQALGIRPGQKMVLLTMGGISEPLDFIGARFLKGLKELNAVLVCPTDVMYMRREGNLVLLPKFSGFYHPDLVNASDGVVGKLGYSTLAEVANSGVPYGFVMRESYPETDHLREYVLGLGNSLEIRKEELEDQCLLRKIGQLISMERNRCEWENGSIASARFLRGLLIEA